MNDDTFVQALGGTNENSLKDKIEIANLENNENDHLNIIKHTSYYDTDKFKNHKSNYKNKTCFNVLSSNIQSQNSVN